MARRRNPSPKPPASTPGATPPAVVVQAADVQVDGTVLSEPQVVTIPEVPAPTSKAKTRSYRVNWTFKGFRKEDLNAGDLVKATEEEAAPFLGGVLSLPEDEA